MKLNGLEKIFKTENGKIVDFKQVNKSGWSPLMYALINNKNKNLNLEQWDYLIKNSDLKKVDKMGYTPLMYALIYNKSQNLNLSKKQCDYLIKNSDLKKVSDARWSTLMYALNHKKREILSQENWEYLIENSDLSLIKRENHLLELKKIQSELLNEKILNKIDITKNINKKVKI